MARRGDSCGVSPMSEPIADTLHRPDPATAGLAVSPLRGRRDLCAWLDLPARLQGDDPHWVAPLRHEQKRLLSRRSNPFFRRGDAEFFLARRGRRTVGRISAHTALPMTGLDPTKVGTFGFFECEDDPAAARALLQAAEGWLARRGARSLLGPINFTLNQECGLLVEGFDSPPFLLMGHNPPRYARLLEGCGYRKLRDLYAWKYTVGAMPPELPRLAARVGRTSGVRIRVLDRARFEEDARTILRIFNEAWKDNWGFSPMHPDEFSEAIRDLRRIVDPELVLLAEKADRVIAIAVSLPNLNEALAGLRGRLLPFGLLRLLWRLKVRRPKTARCLMLGIEAAERGFSSFGLSVLLYVAMSEAAQRRGVQWGELSWTLEDNVAINKGIEATGAVRYKTYRIYSKEIRGQNDRAEVDA